MLYVIGLGLSDEKDITVRGLEAVRKCSRVYLEYYTSILTVPIEKLVREEEFYAKPVLPAYRETVELASDEILRNADTEDVAFLVAGDPLSATTHTDLLLRAAARGVPTQVIHNASILTALGSTGLQLYNFGQTLSLPFYTDTWKPASWYDRLEENLRVGMHTLVLLDIKVREQSEENMARGRLIYEPPRFMSPYTAFQQILHTEAERHPGRIAPSDPTDSDLAPAASAETSSAPESHLVPDPQAGSEHSTSDPRATTTPSAPSAAPSSSIPPARSPSSPSPALVPSLLSPSRTLAIALSRMGTPTQALISGTLAELAALPESTFGPPLHSVVVVGMRLHPLEMEYAGRFCVGGEEGEWWRVGREVYGVERERDW